MVFERATPPALRWVVAFLAVCAALGLWLGFKDQIRRNPPAWYTGAPDPVSPGVQSGDPAIRDATAFDPNAPTQGRAPAVTATPQAKTPEKAEEADDEDAAPDAPQIAPPVLTPPSTTPAAPAAQPAPQRPRPAPSPAPRPAPSEDPVGDLLEPPPSQGAAPVPY
jgi:hypothetical protein